MKKVRISKEAWEQAAIKRGYFKDASSEDRLNKEAFAPLVTGLVGGVLGAAGNWVYDKYKAGDWKERLLGYGIPQEKIEKLKQDVTKIDALYQTFNGLSPNLATAFREFKEQVQDSINRAEAENNAAGKGNIAAGSQALADQQKKQEEEKAKQQAGKAQQPQQAQQAQQPQQAPAAPAEKPEYAPVQNTT
jgi:hypothetical protein